MAGRLWKLRQRFGIAAPKVAVRTQVPWYLRWLGLALLLAFSAAVAAWMYDAGRRFAGFDRSEVAAYLASDTDKQAVARLELEARKADVDIVPFFVFNGKVAVPGAHDAKVLLEAIEQATTETALAVE